MNVDKKNGNVKYADNEHVYWDDDGKYISVTTLISKYCQPFDGDFWSSYKALEKLLKKDDLKWKRKCFQKQKR